MAASGQDQNQSLWSAVGGIDRAIDSIKTEASLLLEQWKPVADMLSILHQRANEEYTRISEEEATLENVMSNGEHLKHHIKELSAAMESLNKAKGAGNQVKALSQVLTVVPSLMHLFGSLDLAPSAEKLLPKAGEDPKQFLWDKCVPETIKTRIREIQTFLLTDSSKITEIARAHMMENLGQAIKQILIQVDDIEISNNIKADHLLTLLPAIDGKSFTNWLRKFGRQQQTAGLTGYPYLAERLVAIQEKIEKIKKEKKGAEEKLFDGKTADALWTSANRDSQALIEKMLTSLGPTRRDSKVILNKLLTALKQTPDRDPVVIIGEFQKSEHQHASAFKKEDIIKLIEEIGALYKPARPGKIAISRYQLEEKRLLRRLIYLSEPAKRKDLLNEVADENPVVSDNAEEKMSESIVSESHFSKQLVDTARKMDALMLSVNSTYEKWQPFIENMTQLTATLNAMKDPAKSGDELEQLINLLTQTIPQKIEKSKEEALRGNYSDSFSSAVDVLQDFTKATTLFDSLKWDEAIKKLLMKKKGWLTPKELLENLLPTESQDVIKKTMAVLENQTSPQAIKEMTRESQLLVLSTLQMTAQNIRSVKSIIKKIENNSAFKEGALLSIIPVPGFKENLGVLIDRFDIHYRASLEAAGYPHPTEETVNLDLSDLMDKIKKALPNINVPSKEEKQEIQDLLESVENFLFAARNQLKLRLDPFVYENYFHNTSDTGNLFMSRDEIPSSIQHAADLFISLEEMSRQYRVFRDSKAGLTPLSDVKALADQGGALHSIADLAVSVRAAIEGLAKDPTLQSILNSDSFEEVFEKSPMIKRIISAGKNKESSESHLASLVKEASHLVEKLASPAGVSEKIKNLFKIIKFKEENKLPASSATLLNGLEQDLTYFITKTVPKFKKIKSVSDVVAYLPAVISGLSQISRMVSTIKLIHQDNIHDISDAILNIAKETHQLLVEAYLIADTAEIASGLREGTLTQSFQEPLQQMENVVRECGFSVTELQDRFPCADALLKKREALQAKPGFSPLLVEQRISEARDKKSKYASDEALREKWLAQLTKAIGALEITKKGLSGIWKWLMALFNPRIKEQKREIKNKLTGYQALQKELHDRKKSAQETLQETKKLEWYQKAYTKRKNHSAGMRMFKKQNTHPKEGREVSRPKNRAF